MKILFAIKSLKNYGGAEKVFVDIVNKLHALGYDITVLTFDKSLRNSSYKLNQQIRYEELNCISKKKINILLFIRILIKLRSVLLKIKPQKIVSFMHSMIVPMEISRLGIVSTHIGSEHTTIKYYKKRKLELLLYKLAALSIDKITTVNKNIKKKFPNIIKSKMIVIPNPIQEKSSTLDKQNKKKKIILTVGRMVEEKQQIILLRSFYNISNYFPDWKLKIIGQGQLKNEIIKVIKELKLQKRVIIQNNTKDIFHEYKKASIFVLPSKIESMGLAALEAMSVGLPVIGFSYCEGLREFLNNKNGLLINCNHNESVTKLSNTLKRLIKDKKLRNKLSSQAKKITNYKAQNKKVYESWEKLLTPC